MSEHPSMLGVYPVERELGRGGMGVVYLARDPRLNRQVAIKVLPSTLGFDQESLARFEREAKLLASLNHPNIATIYGVDDAAGQRLLVLEYVPGQTLAERIASGPLPLDEALDVCRQIAAAIEAAHEGAVIHRDLKPGNVKITPDGKVKVLDFGLAKGSATVSDADLANSPTLTQAGTMAGVILGTAAYMSPEQARGKPVDRRTDIWSLGCVLFECLTGRQLFHGETVSDTIAKILEREPAWATLPEATPPRVRDLLRRSLEKDLKKRQRDVGDVRIELEEAAAARATSARSTAEMAPLAPPRTTTPKSIALAAALVVLGAAAGIALWNTIGPGARITPGSIAGPLRVSVGVPPAIHAYWAGITSDGRTLVIAGALRRSDGSDEPRARLYTRRLDADEFKPLPGTDGVETMALKPDGKWLAFVAAVSDQSTQRRIAKVLVDGSAPPVALADWDDDWGTNVTWLEDGDLLVTSNGDTKFFRLPTGGGQARPAIAFDTGSVRGSPAFGNGLPGDRGVFFTMESWGARGYQLDEWLLDPKTGKAQRLFESAGSAAYSPTGHIVFSRGAVLMAAPFDLSRLAVTGEVTTLPGSVRTTTIWDNGAFNVSKDGTLVSIPGGRMGTDRRLVTVDSSGKVVPFIAESRAFESQARSSRDGRKVAVVIPNAKGTYETWVADLDHAGLRRVLMLPDADCAGPAWSPDGTRLAYRRTARDKDDGVYLRRIDGTGSSQPVVKDDSREVALGPTSWAPDGSGIIVGRVSGGKSDILFVPLSPSGEASKPRPLRVTAAGEANGRFSPDGRLVSFSSDESGREEVYVAAYGADGVLGPPLPVSRGGGSKGAWAAERRLVYLSPLGTLMSVTIATGSALSASAPVVAFDLKKLRLGEREWDIMPDGKLLAIQKGEGEDDITAFNVVLNWFDELRAKMGAK
jgi:serine/threonine-protein kinase